MCVCARTDRRVRAHACMYARTRMCVFEYLRVVTYLRQTHSYVARVKRGRRTVDRATSLKYSYVRTWAPHKLYVAKIRGYVYVVFYYSSHVLVLS